MQRTVPLFILTVTGKFMPKDLLYQNRVPSTMCHKRIQGRYSMLELDEGKLCAAGRGAESLTQSRGVRRETPGSSTYLRAKAGGDKSMSEKRESLEGVYDAVPQDPRDMVKATLPESQSPVVEPHTHRYHASDAVLSRACRSSFAVRTLRVMDDVQRAHSRG